MTVNQDAVDQNKVPLSHFNSIPEYLQTIADYEQQAKLHLPHASWEYLHGGAMDGKSISANRQQFDNIQLIPRHLNDFSHGNTGLTLFGQHYTHPIFLAPIGHQQLFHPQGELATSLASEVMQSNFILSTFTNTDLTHIKKQLPHKWFQLYWQADRNKSLALVKLAEQHDYKALVITIDSPHTGIRDRERQAFFQLPPEMQHPHTPSHFFAEQVAPDKHPLFQGLMALAPQWHDIAWIVNNTTLPVILKGVLHPKDAQQAIHIGVKGLIISNHGGRVLDGTISPLTALQYIKPHVDEHFPLFLDGGIRRGTDIFKALALGASAVLIGRPYIYGLAVAGALGAAHTIKILKEELEITMALMGTPTLDSINNEFIYQK